MSVDWTKHTDPVTGLIGYSSWGLLGQNDPEQDAPYHTCHKYFLEYLYNDRTKEQVEWDIIKAVKQFSHKSSPELGTFRRFPTEGQNAIRDGKLNPSFGVSEYSYYNNPANISRDNTLPIILVLGLTKRKVALKNFIKNMIKRGSFFQNTHDTRGIKKFLPDLATPDHWGVIIRAYLQAHRSSNLALRDILAFPLLMVCDLFMILSNLLTVIHSWYEPNHAPSELGHICRSIQADIVMPTPLSKVAKWLYVYGRRRASSVFPDKIRHIGKWEYFKLWCKVTFTKYTRTVSRQDKKFLIHNATGFSIGEEMYYDKCPAISGLKYFERGKYDANFAEYSRKAVRQYLDRRA